MRIRPFLKLIVASQLLFAAAWAANAPLVISVWPHDAPGSEGKMGDEMIRVTAEGEHVVSRIHHPSLTVFLPPAGTSTGAAVVICPGGGHRELWIDHEGYNVAQWLAAHGIAGFVLKYRLAREEGSTYQVGTHALADLQRSIQVVRSRAAEWRVDAARVGVLGFSSGGELAALAGAHGGAADDGISDQVGRQSSKPAFQALLYPGNSEQIIPSSDSPPAFLVCGYGDRTDISEGLARVYLRFKQAGVPAELHIYTGIGHGFGIRDTNHSPSGTWPERFREWLDDRGFLRPVPPEPSH